MKKIIAIIVCVIASYGACVVWAYAEIWAKQLDTNASLFDAAAALLLLTALASSTYYCTEKKKGEGCDKDNG